MNYMAAKSGENIQGLIPPYHGKLVNLLVDNEEREQLVQCANELPSLQLSPRSFVISSFYP